MLDADTLSWMGIAAQAAMDKKAFDLVGLEVGELTSYADGLVLCSAASERQVGAVADEILKRLKQVGSQPLHKEGAGRSDWMLLDYGDFVVHIFTEDRRAYYGLDSLWGDAPRLGEAALGIDRSAGSASR